MRQSFFARRLQMLLFPLVIVMVCACNDFNIVKDDDVIIEIVSADSANGLLLAANGELLQNSGDDTVQVYPGKNVFWFVGRDAGSVDNFYIEKKQGSEDIFSLFSKPPSKPTRVGAGKVRKIRRGLYVYSIIWTDSLGKKHTFDPKIAIMP